MGLIRLMRHTDIDRLNSRTENITKKIFFSMDCTWHGPARLPSTCSQLWSHSFGCIDEASSWNFQCSICRDWSHTYLKNRHLPFAAFVAHDRKSSRHAKISLHAAEWHKCREIWTPYLVNTHNSSKVIGFQANASEWKFLLEKRDLMQHWRHLRGHSREHCLRSIAQFARENWRNRNSFSSLNFQLQRMRYTELAFRTEILRHVEGLNWFNEIV